MKPHIRLKFRQAWSVDAPYWRALAAANSNSGTGSRTVKPDVVTSIHADIDALFAKYQLPIWVTREYKPAGQTWSQAELASGFDRIYRLVLQHTAPIPTDLIQEIARLPIVEDVRIGEVGQAALPEMHAMQMDAMTDLRSRKAIYLPEAHQLTEGDPRITIAVLDTGVNLTHPELVHALLPGYDFVDIIDGSGKFIGDYLDADEIPEDEVGHGTHVAGIIAAQGAAMPRGVVPQCKILPVRVLGAMQRGSKRVGAGLVDNINAGIKWAIDQGAQVINMSLGIQHTGGGLPHREVVEYAQRKGVTIVAASGNDGTEQLYYPSALPYVLAVGAADEAGRIAPFSTFGKVDLLAPGTNIYSSYLDRTYAPSTGTSHASPFVAGAVAALKSHALQQWDTRLRDKQVKFLLKHSADKIDTRFKHQKAGFGMLNLIDALRLLDYKLSS